MMWQEQQVGTLAMKNKMLNKTSRRADSEERNFDHLVVRMLFLKLYQLLQPVT